MRKNKTPQGKICGKSMKKIFVCLLSLSMIPANGVAVFANNTNQTVKVSSNETTKSSIGFAVKEMEATVGKFDLVPYKNIEEIKSATVTVAPEDASKIKLPKCYNYFTYDDNVNVYRIAGQEEGVTAKLIGKFEDKNGNIIEDTMTVKLKGDSNVVPIKSYELYESLYRDEDYDEARKSADANGDHAISPKELSNVIQIKNKNSKKGFTDDDLKVLKNAIGCKVLSLSVEDNITNIEFAKDMKELEIVNLDSTKVSDITPLKDVKNKLKSVNFKNTKISAKDRLSFVQNKELKVKEGTQQRFNILPEGIIEDEDQVTIDDGKFKIIETKSTEDEFYDYNYLLDAQNAKNKDSAKINVSNNGEKIEIPVKVEEKDSIVPEFKDDSKQLNIGHLEKIKLKNVEDIDDNYIYIEPATDSDAKIIRTDRYDDNDETEEGTYYFIPRAEGKATLEGSFETDDGTIYKDYMQVEVKGLESDEYIPINNISLSYYSYDKDGNVADRDRDGRLTKEEFSKIVEVNLCGIEYITDKDLDILEPIRNQLKALDLRETSVSDEKRLSYIKKDKLVLKEGTQITDIFGIDQVVDTINDDISVENPEIADFRIEYDIDGAREYFVLETTKGKEGQSTNLIIKTKNGVIKKIPIEIVGKEGIISLKSISLNKTEISLMEGQTERLTVSYQPENATNKNIKWASSDSTVASVSDQGIVTANKTGTAEITAEASNGYKVSCKVTVRASQQHKTVESLLQKVENIKITGLSNNIAAGKKVKLTATITPTNVANKSVTWTTSNKKVATVNASGVVSINKKAAGKSVTITATAKDGSGKKASYKIKVMKGAVKKVKISGKKSVKAGKTLKLKAKVTASKGANKKLIWTSSNPKYATVSSSGKVKALKAGKKKSVKITAMATDGSGKSKTVTIKIK